MKQHVAAIVQCPCGTGLQYERCCGRYVDGTAHAPDAEALMRSRYTAYTLGNEAYLLASWHPKSRPRALGLASEAATKWLGLNVKRHASTGPDTAVVEFVARYKVDGRAYRLHEISRFARVDDQWMYLDGDLQGDA